MLNYELIMCLVIINVENIFDSFMETAIYIFCLLIEKYEYKFE